MSSPSFVSNDDSTSICAADASLDMSATRYGAKALDMPCGARSKKALSTLVANGNISNFEQSEKYIDCSLASKYRVAKQHIDKKKGLLSNDRQ